MGLDKRALAAGPRAWEDLENASSENGQERLRMRRKSWQHRAEEVSGRTL